MMSEPWTDPFVRLAIFLVIASRAQVLYDLAIKKTPLPTTGFARFLAWSLAPPDTQFAMSEDEQRRNKIDGGSRLVSGLFRLTPGILLVALNHVHPVRDLGWVAYWAYVAALTLLLPQGTFDVIIGSYMRLTGNYVAPMFNRPVAAKSVREFWGKRWNLMFVRSATRSMFLPLLERGYSPLVATMAVFLFSGVAHEALIYAVRGSFDGYNFAFFCLQGLAVITERLLGASSVQVPEVVSRLLTWMWFGLTAPLFFHAFIAMFPVLF